MNTHIVLGLLAAALLVSCQSALPAPSPSLATSPASVGPQPSLSASASPAGSATPIPFATSVQLSVPIGGSVVWALVASSRLFRSLDRGDTWQERLVPAGASNVRVSFVSDAEGWILGGRSLQTPCSVQSIKIWHTVDGAATWTESSSAGIADTGCKDGIYFVSTTSTTIGFVTLAGQDQAPVLYRTADGGNSWRPTLLADPPGPARTTDVRYFNGPIHAFGSALLVTLVREATPGETNFVYRSMDGGVSWTYLAKLPFGSSPAFITAAHWALLLTPGQSQETADAGVTWHASASEYRQAAPVLPQVEFADPQVGYATVRGSIQRTTDGAVHWTPIRTPGTG